MYIMVISLFPEVFTSFLNACVTKKAIEQGAIKVDFTNPRDYASGSYKSVDDYLYGGSAGMLMKPEPIAEAINHIRSFENFKKAPIIYFTPQGVPLNQKTVVQLSLLKNAVFLCGHYKGIDERIRTLYVDQEISMGDYVLSNGEIPAIALIDAIARLLPNVLGNIDSANEDSFSDGLLDGPRYTRPEEFKGIRVPHVLLSGNHAKIKSWERKQTLIRTRERRPDLINRAELDAEDKMFINSL
ncbi:MAG: tRNA (guanosine(37)-N1)-methyltransferase TrmD [bacterium]